MTFVVNTVRYFMPRGDGADVALNPGDPSLLLVRRWPLWRAIVSFLLSCILRRRYNVLDRFLPVAEMDSYGIFFSPTKPKHEIFL